LGGSNPCQGTLHQAWRREAQMGIKIVPIRGSRYRTCSHDIWMLGSHPSHPNRRKVENASKHALQALLLHFAYK